MAPFAAFLRNLGWDIERLNDLFGRWALANIEWSYGKGPLFRNEYGDYVGDGLGRGRCGSTGTHGENGDLGTYMPPDILAPQRWGYNVVHLSRWESMNLWLSLGAGTDQISTDRSPG